MARYIHNRLQCESNTTRTSSPCLSIMLIYLSPTTIYIIHFSPPPPKHLLPQPIPPFLLRNLLRRLNKIVRNAITHNTILLILRVRRNKVPDPLRRRPVRAVCALPDQIKVRGDVAARLDVNVHAVEIRFHEWDEAREAVAVRGLLAVDDFVDGHFLVLVLHRADGRSGSARFSGRRCAGSVVVARPVRGKGVFAEPEFLRRHGVADVCCFHIFRYPGDGHVEVEVEGEDGARDEHDEDTEGGVLEIGDLDLHGAELDTPANVRTGWRRLEAHVLPIC